MAIILKDFEPSGAVEEVQLPGSKERFKIPVSEDVLTVEALQDLARGDYAVILDLFPAEGQKLFKQMRLPQVREFVEAWTGSAKN